jgi:hypothetical protein
MSMLCALLPPPPSLSLSIVHFRSSEKREPPLAESGILLSRMDEQSPATVRPSETVAAVSEAPGFALPSPSCPTPLNALFHRTSGYGSELTPQRNSLPDIPLTPRERQILEQTAASSALVRSSHSSESILRDSSPPPQPPQPDRCVYPGRLLYRRPNSATFLTPGATLSPASYLHAFLCV